MKKTDLQELIKELLQQELEEANTTGTGASFTPGDNMATATPNAFAKKGKWKGKKVKYAENINEISYSKFKNETKATPQQKIGKGIMMVERMLKEITRIVEFNQRLKTEMDVKSGSFWKSTQNRIGRIGESISNLNNKIKEFGS
jgi:hypothetical protein